MLEDCVVQTLSSGAANAVTTWVTDDAVNIPHALLRVHACAFALAAAPLARVQGLDELTVTITSNMVGRLLLSCKHGTNTVVLRVRDCNFTFYMLPVIYSNYT